MAHDRWQRPYLAGTHETGDSEEEATHTSLSLEAHASTQHPSLHGALRLRRLLLCLLWDRSGQQIL
jgi:hypothetical protein